jgi:hypothetical protein
MLASDAISGPFSQKEEYSTARFPSFHGIDPSDGSIIAAGWQSRKARCRPIGPSMVPNGDDCQIALQAGTDVL